MDIDEDTFNLLYAILTNSLTRESKSYLVPLASDNDAVFAGLGRALFNEKVIEILIEQTKQLESDE